jgi:hypothetical protein
MGRQGYLILAIIIAGSALFAATRHDWPSMLVSALGLPLMTVALFQLLSRFWRSRPQVRDSRYTPRQNVDPLTFLARTNPLMLLLFGALSRGTDDGRYGELLRSGPYGLGQYGYLIALLIIIGPLILALIIMAFTGQLPAHIGPHLP